MVITFSNRKQLPKSSRPLSRSFPRLPPSPVDRSAPVASSLHHTTSSLLLYPTRASMDRLPIALHLHQELLPLSGAGSLLLNGKGQAPSKVIGSGSGYGPPLAPEGTPLSRLVAATLYTPPAEPTPAEAAQGWAPAGGRTEYDLVCLPLTNSSWQERWERMCTISSSGTMTDVRGGINGMSSAASARDLGEDATRREAESWRAGGGFGRGEVNVTRSGQFLFTCVRGLQLSLDPVRRGSRELDRTRGRLVGAG
jgi:hypothetical protein